MLRPSLIAGFVLLTLPLAAQQQDTSAPPPKNPPPQTTPQKKDQPKKSTPAQNPFPEAQSEAAQDSSAAPDAPAPQTAPANPPPTGAQAKPSTSDQNPFPEAQSEKAAHEAQQQDQPSPAAPPAFPDDQSYSSSQVKGLGMPDTPETPPAALPPSTLPYNSKLARKDAEIGDYYMESGNWRGAYDRFLQANQSDPGNAEAVYGLAESARHLDHRDEALRNYRLYLSALPNGPHAKEIRKALKEMGAEPPA